MYRIPNPIWYRISIPIWYPNPKPATSDPGRSWRPDILSWSALGPLRLHYTAFTGDVTSKRGAGEYGLTVVPEHLHDVVRRALAVRAGTTSAATDTDEMLHCADLITWVIDDVTVAAR